VAADRIWGKVRQCQVLDEGPEKSHQLFAGREVFLQSHPGARPTVQIAAVARNIGGVTSAAAGFILEDFGFSIIRAMELTTILNHCYPQPGLVYLKARFRAAKKALEVSVRPRKTGA
jgi:hypothetical protein